MNSHLPQEKSLLEKYGRNFQAQFLKDRKETFVETPTCVAALTLREPAQLAISESTWDRYMIYTVPIKIFLPEIWDEVTQSVSNDT